MDNREAIEKFKKIKKGSIFLIHQRIEGKEVIEDYSLCDMAISALQAQIDGDCISRQAAIDTIRACRMIYSGTWGKGLAMAEERLRELPSAQPEIIRCKDCIKREMCRTSTTWAVAPKDDWYCADAGRRPDA